MRASRVSMWARVVVTTALISSGWRLNSCCATSSRARPSMLASCRRKRSSCAASGIIVLWWADARVREVVEGLLPTDGTVQPDIRLIHAMATARRSDSREQAQTRIRTIRDGQQTTLHTRPLDADPRRIHRWGQIVGRALAVFACQADHRMPTKIAVLDNLGRGVLGHQRLTRHDEVAIGVPLAAGRLSRVFHSALLLAHRRSLAGPPAQRCGLGRWLDEGWLAE